jgi:hypothetical protein
VSHTEFNEAKDMFFSEPPVDDIYLENIDTGEASFVFALNHFRDSSIRELILLLNVFRYLHRTIVLK